MRPNSKDIPIPCPACKLMDFEIVHNEISGQTIVRCQHCRVTFIGIQHVPAEAPDPSIVI